MCVKEWKRIAEWEASHYRERIAFLKGIEDAGGEFTTRAAQYRKWVRATDYVLDYLKRNDEEKERFFRICYGLDGGRRRAGKKQMLVIVLEGIGYLCPQGRQDFLVLFDGGSIGIFDMIL